MASKDPSNPEDLKDILGEPIYLLIEGGPYSKIKPYRQRGIRSLIGTFRRERERGYRNNAQVYVCIPQWTLVEDFSKKNS